MSGRATFSDDIAATTAARARHTTTITARVLIGFWVVGGVLMADPSE
jgi:hypothetical protein